METFTLPSMGTILGQMQVPSGVAVPLANGPSPSHIAVPGDDSSLDISLSVALGRMMGVAEEEECLQRQLVHTETVFCAEGRKRMRCEFQTAEAAWRADCDSQASIDRAEATSRLEHMEFHRQELLSAIQNEFVSQEETFRHGALAELGRQYRTALEISGFHQCRRVAVLREKGFRVTEL